MTPTRPTRPTPTSIVANVEALKAVRNAVPSAGDARLPKEVVNLHNGMIPSPLGRGSSGNDAARLRRSVVAGGVVRGSSEQRGVNQKKLRDAAAGCSMESQKNKLSSLKDTVKQRQEPTNTSKSHGDSYPHKNRFSRFAWKNGDNQFVRTILGIILIIFLSKGLKSSVTLPEAFEMYSNIRAYESQFSEGSTSTERRDDQDLCETMGLKAVGIRSSSSTQSIEVPSQVEENKSSDKNDETLTTSQNLEQADGKPWLRWFLVVHLVLGPFIYAYANNHFISPSSPISIVDAVPMTLVTTLAIWIVRSSSLADAINISRSLVKLLG